MLIGCIVMAAGFGTRFGENKLLCAFGGRPLFAHVLGELPMEKISKVCVVTHYEEIFDAAKKRGLAAVYNMERELGISYTIRLGMKEMSGMDGVIFAVADQPLLKKATIEMLIDDFSQNPNNIVSLAFKDRRANPVIFPGKYFAELSALTGDEGGGQVIRAHKESLRLVQAANEWETNDVDTILDMAELENCWRRKNYEEIKYN